MATVNIQGFGPVKVDDKFLQLSPDDQNKQVEEIASQLRSRIVAHDINKTAKGEKYDTLGEVIGGAIENAPESALKFAGDMVTPFLHPIQTAKTFKDIGRGLIEKLDRMGALKVAGTAGGAIPFVGPAIAGGAQAYSAAKDTGVISGTGHEQYADAVGEFFKERYGSVAAVKKTIATDPVGFVADLSMVLTLGGSAAERAPGMVGTVARAAKTAGQAIDPITAAPRAVAKIAPAVLGTTTGAGSDAIKIAARAGAEGGEAAQAFTENMRGQAPLTDVVTSARQAVTHLREERGEAYREAMAKIGADTTVLDFDKIDAAVQKAAGVKMYKGQVINPSTHAIRESIAEHVDQWARLDPKEYHTAEGLDALKQQIGSIRDATQYGTPDRVVADGVYHAIRNTIVEQAPEYGKAMKAYEQASDIIQEMEKTLSLRPGANVDTALRKLTSVLRNNVNTNYGRRGELVAFLQRAGAKHLLESIGGQMLNTTLPRGLAGTMAAVGDVGAAALGGKGVVAKAIAAAPFLSPRLMGEAAYGAGVADRMTRRLPRRAIAQALYRSGQLQNR